MGRQIDIGSHNPRLQCAGCGKWMRLHGIKDGQAIQRFNGSCDVTLGDHPLGGEVCTDCCPTKCRNHMLTVKDQTGGAA
jgi:ribosomal protein L34E